MSARDAIGALYSADLLPSIPFPEDYTIQPNYFLAVNETGDAFEYVPTVPADAGVNRIANTDLNITVSQPQGNVTLNLADDIAITGQLTSGQVVYPNTLGTNNQVLGVSGGALTFINQTGGGGGNYTAGENIDATALASNIIQTTESITVQELNIGSEYSLPLVLGTDAQVLGVSNGNLAFISGGSYTAGDNIDATALASNVIQTTADITVDSLTFTDSYSFPTTIGDIGQVLGVNNGVLQFIDQTGGNTFTAGNNIDPTALASNVIQTLQDVEIATVNVNNLVIEGIGFPPPTTNDGGKVLTVTVNDPVITMSWETGTGGGGIQEVVADPNQTSIVVTTQNQIATIGLADDVVITNNLDVDGNLTVHAPGGLTTPGAVIDGVAFPATATGVYYCDSTTSTFTPLVAPLYLDTDPTPGIAIGDFTSGTLNFSMNGRTAAFPDISATNADSGKVLQMTVNNSTTTLSWETVSGGGAVNSVQGSENILVSPATGTPVITLDSNITEVDSIECKEYWILANDSTKLGLPSITADADTIPQFQTILTNGTGGSNFGYVIKEASSTTLDLNVDNYSMTVELPAVINTVTTKALALTNSDNTITVEFPTIAVQPTEGDYLQVDSNGNLIFSASQPDGVQSVAAGTNINLTGTITAPVVNLDTEIEMTGVTTKSLVLESADGSVQIQFPAVTTAPAEGDVLQVGVNNTLVFAPNAADGVQSVSEGTNIIISGTQADPVVGLTADITLTSVTAETITLKNSDGSVTVEFPTITTQPTEGDYLQVDASGNLIFSPSQPDGVQSVTAGSNISLTGTSTAPVVNLANNVTTNGATLKQLTLTNSDGSVSVDFPAITTQPTSGYVLSVNAQGNLAFTENAADGVQSVTEGTNISVTGTSTDPIVSLNSEISVNRLTIESQNGLVTYDLPTISNQITQGQTMVADIDGNLQFDFTVLSLAGSSNIQVSGSTGDIGISLVANPEVVEITTESITLNGNAPNSITATNAINLACSTATDGCVLHMVGPSSAHGLILDAQNSVVSTSAYEAAAGTTGGDHVLTSTVVARDIFVVSKNESPEPLYSYRLPEVIYSTAVPTGSIIRVNAADMNLNQTQSFVTPDMVFDNTSSDIAFTYSQPVAQGNLRASSRAVSSYLTTDASDMATLVWQPIQTVKQTFWTLNNELVNGASKYSYAYFRLCGTYNQATGQKTLELRAMGMGEPLTDYWLWWLEGAQASYLSIDLSGVTALLSPAGANPSEPITTYLPTSNYSPVLFGNSFSTSQTVFMGQTHLASATNGSGSSYTNVGYCTCYLNGSILNFSFFNSDGTAHNLDTAKYYRMGSFDPYNYQIQTNFQASFN